MCHEAVYARGTPSVRKRFEALDGVLRCELWLRLRSEQRLSVRRAGTLLHRLVDAVPAAPLQRS